ncbi:hypothetical protein HPB50_021024 [Hyalomma asiaticum]|uniref:Uncharacterized protein n=1 Tax=Hyalomma asiaticum TaxID=266040 RepID=A0ACB7T690_HYAAI|nr:hypothetical protein HPB50_021024 [Hyalomma asiaticum]
MSSYELPANANEDVLRRKPSLLLDQLLSSLQKLTRLEFSLVEVEDATEETIKIWDFRKVHLGKKTSLCEMYVEVMNDDNMKLLLGFVEYSPLLKDIHIYITKYIRTDYGVISCLRIVETLKELAIFTLTCEAPSTTQSEPFTQPLDLQKCMRIHGTVVFRKSTNSLSYALLRDLATSPGSVLPIEPAVLVAVKRPDLEAQLFYASSRHNWSELQSLCLLLFLKGLHANVYPVTQLCPANALERLCIVTTTKLNASKAKMIVASMGRQLPSIFYLHIHYVDVETRTMTSVTWIRASEGDVAEEWSRPGKVMLGKPCIMCSTQTFVALPKPRCREL